MAAPTTIEDKIRSFNKTRNEILQLHESTSSFDQSTTCSSLGASSSTALSFASTQSSLKDRMMLADEDVPAKPRATVDNLLVDFPKKSHNSSSNAQQEKIARWNSSSSSISTSLRDLYGDDPLALWERDAAAVVATGGDCQNLISMPTEQQSTTKQKKKKKKKSQSRIGDMIKESARLRQNEKELRRKQKEAFRTASVDLELLSLSSRKTGHTPRAA